MSKDNSFTIKQGEEDIELIKLLKVLNIAESGALAQILVTNEEVKRNNVVELRKRAKIRRGETIEVFGQVINIV